MAKYSAQLKATSSAGKTVTTSIPNVNPDASTETILGFTQRLNQLTTNTYDSTDYIVTTNLDVDDDTRTTTTLSLTDETFFTGLTSLTNSKSTAFSTNNSNGVISVAVNGLHGLLAGIVVHQSSGEEVIRVEPSGQNPYLTAGTITIRITGNANYKPFEHTYEFT